MRIMDLCMMANFNPDAVIPALIMLMGIAFVVVIAAMASRYKKFSPNEVGIFYGRRYKGADGKVVGFRVVSGGGSLLWPIVEHLQVMSTAAFQTSINETGIPNKDNVRINVKGVATCKISSTETGLQNAASAFLGKQPKEIENMITQILLGHLRSIIGKMNIDEILRDRDAFNKKVVEESREELQRLGVEVINLVIQDVNDVHGYIDALGQKAVAEAVRDAKIKVAEANRDSNIKVAEAQAETEQKISTAQRTAAVVAAQNAVSTAEAERDRDVKKAEFAAAVSTKQAQAEQALPIATAEQEKVLRQKEAERDEAAAEAQIKVQIQQAKRKEAELVATVIKPAEAEKQKAVINAEAAQRKAVIDADAAKTVAETQASAAKQVAILNAEASQQSAIKKAEGEKQAAIATGEGEASRTKAVKLAQAEGDAAIKQRQLEAEAAGTKAKLLAQAEGDAAQKGKVLMAEAEGTKALAAALRELSDAGKLIIILDKLPNLLDHGGKAGAEILRAMFEPMAAGLSAIDTVHIVDMGGQSNGVKGMANTIPNFMFELVAKAKAAGIDLNGLGSKLGIDFTKVMETVGGTPSSAAALTAPAGTDATPDKK